MKNKTCGVYKIINQLNGHYYIGSSTNIEQRWYNHKRNALKNLTQCPHLYSAIRKYGVDNFRLEISTREINSWF